MTGASSGFGALIAQQLEQDGYYVYASARRAEKLQALESKNIQAAPLDVTDQSACQKVYQHILAEKGRIDLLVNNAGYGYMAPVEDATVEAIHQQFDVNVYACTHLMQLVTPQMRQQSHGCIINMSSVSAQRGGGIFGGPHYSAAKAGILGLTKAMARELAPDGVRANAICPGFIDTDITAGKLTPEMRAQVLDGIPMGRAGTANDVAGCCLFLASDLSAYVTGSEVDVNGGSLIH